MRALSRLSISLRHPEVNVHTWTHNGVCDGAGIRADILPYPFFVYQTCMCNVAVFKHRKDQHRPTSETGRRGGAPATTPSLCVCIPLYLSHTASYRRPGLSHHQCFTPPAILWGSATDRYEGLLYERGVTTVGFCLACLGEVRALRPRLVIAEDHALGFFRSRSGASGRRALPFPSS